MTPLLISPPPVEPISIAEAKTWLRIDTAAEDALLQSLIVAARLTLEAYTRRFFITQTWRLTLDAWPPSLSGCSTIAIAFAPFKNVAQIRVYDAAGVAASVPAASYVAPASNDGGRITFRARPPAPGAATDGIEIDIVVGYGGQPADAPEPLRNAILALVANWYENRGDGAPADAPLSSRVTALARPFRRERLA